MTRFLAGVLAALLVLAANAVPPSAATPSIAVYPPVTQEAPATFDVRSRAITRLRAATGARVDPIAYPATMTPETRDRDLAANAKASGFDRFVVITTHQDRDAVSIELALYDATSAQRIGSLTTGLARFAGDPSLDLAEMLPRDAPGGATVAVANSVPAPPVVTPAPIVITPAPPVVTPAPPVVTPAPPVVTPAPPVVTPAPPIVTPPPPVATPVPRVATPAPPVATPAPVVTATPRTISATAGAGLPPPPVVSPATAPADPAPAERRGGLAGINATFRNLLAKMRPNGADTATRMNLIFMPFERDGTDPQSVRASTLFVQEITALDIGIKSVKGVDTSEAMAGTICQITSADAVITGTQQPTPNGARTFGIALHPCDPAKFLTPPSYVQELRRRFEDNVAKSPSTDPVVLAVRRLIRTMLAAAE